MAWTAQAVIPEQARTDATLVIEPPGSQNLNGVWLQLQISAGGADSSQPTVISEGDFPITSPASFQIGKQAIAQGRAVVHAKVRGMQPNGLASSFTFSGKLSVAGQSLAASTQVQLNAGETTVFSDLFFILDPQ